MLATWSQQVPDAAAPVAEQVECMHDVDVLRQNDHCDVGVLLADAPRRPQPLVDLPGRHPDVDDERVRLGLGDEPVDLLGLAGLREDGNTTRIEQRRESLAEKGRVVREHDAQGGHSRSS